MTTIGILGAGQLGRLLALAGYPFGIRFRFLDPDPASPAGVLADHRAFQYSDSSAFEKFASGLDLITYEFENIPVNTVRDLERLVPVYPLPIALEKAQDRFVEKSYLCEIGIPTPKFTTDFENDALDKIGYPAVLKTRRLGYDGKGQVVVHSKTELKALLENANKDELILEEFVSFERELSLIGVRNQEGETRFYPLVENLHGEGILQVSLVQGDTLPELQKMAEAYGISLLSSLDYVGILTVEFFEKDGSLLANEMAPRVHNSGHWTIEGAVTSQFENHLRAISGLPLGSTDPLGVCAMVNLIGNLPDIRSILKIDGTHLHLYDKAARPKRKIGHVTLVEQDIETLMRKLDLVKEVVGVSG